MTTWQYEVTTVALLVALVAVLAVRTALTERAAGSGGRDGTASPRVAWSRPRVVRRLDMAACVLSVLWVGVLAATVVAALVG